MNFKESVAQRTTQAIMADYSKHLNDVHNGTVKGSQWLMAQEEADVKECCAMMMLMIDRPQEARNILSTMPDDNLNTLGRLLGLGFMVVHTTVIRAELNKREGRN